MERHYRGPPTRPWCRDRSLGTEHGDAPVEDSAPAGRAAPEHAADRRTSRSRLRGHPHVLGRGRQLMISPRSSAARAAIRPRQDARSSGLRRGQSATSRTTRSGALLRNERVGLPGNFLSVTLGSSSYGPVGSTSYTRGSASPAASSAARPAPPTSAVKYTWFIVTSGR